MHSLMAWRSSFVHSASTFCPAAHNMRFGTVEQYVTNLNKFVHNLRALRNTTKARLPPKLPSRGVPLRYVYKAAPVRSAAGLSSCGAP